MEGILIGILDHIRRNSEINTPQNGVSLPRSEYSPIEADLGLKQGFDDGEALIVACIPAFNEMASIGKVIVETHELLDKVIVCDDGSTDLTYDIANDLGAITIRNEKNRGKGYSLKQLFSKALELNPDVVVMLDGDGQHDPREIPKLVKPILKGEADFVIGSRYIEGSCLNAPLYRRLGLRIINSLRITEVRDTQSGLRAFSRKALEVVMRAESNGYGVETEQLSLAKKHGLRVLEVPTNIKYGGNLTTSKKNPFSHGVEIILTLIRLVTEERPLLTLGVPACLLFFVSLISGYYLFLYYQNGRYFSMPWALSLFFSFLLSALLGLSALFLFSIQKLTRRFDDAIESLKKRELNTE